MFLSDINKAVRNNGHILRQTFVEVGSEGHLLSFAITLVIIKLIRELAGNKTVTVNIQCRNVELHFIARVSKAHGGNRRCCRSCSLLDDLLNRYNLIRLVERTTNPVLVDVDAKILDT